MRKHKAWLERGEQRVNSCKPMKDETRLKKARQAYARKAGRSLVANHFGTISLAAPTEAQLRKANLL